MSAERVGDVFVVIIIIVFGLIIVVIVVVVFLSDGVNADVIIVIIVLLIFSFCGYFRADSGCLNFSTGGLLLCNCSLFAFDGFCGFCLCLFADSRDFLGGGSGGSSGDCVGRCYDRLYRRRLVIIIFFFCGFYF